jgi:hypothetical protein
MIEVVAPVLALGLTLIDWYRSPSRVHVLKALGEGCWPLHRSCPPAAVSVLDIGTAMENGPVTAWLKQQETKVAGAK